MTESRLLHDVQRALGRGSNFRLARNNTGVGKYCAQCEIIHASTPHPAYRMVKYGIPGAPDILGILGPHGTTFGIEMKSETGKTAPIQLAYHAMLKKFGGHVQVVRSVREAEDWMRSIGGVWK